ncbi:fimbrial protein [Pseudomonas vancouverensis]|uniref:Type 1 fimbrial protein n=1 Tax=Pseudomonas vancouverensis TaxID=95300 RepID=A0A1H2N380_PSEVA|nr:fimbrial protein [Pseudomonas vancouverensis]KAB0495807.1 type 1 fimbrial protein [Pseudomonas vancouverensis]TDB65609.1 type 1 fimbrial protein [Pseudomonas vancouverensis]SDU99804.1 major type 1 subunit fimbrin (pilin) [Pseudomonas vancouverensis]
MTKFAKISMAAAAVVGATLFATSAFAVDGTITITGKVEDASCNVTVAGNASGNNLPLPTVFKSALASDGATAGATGFQFNLSGCPVTGAVLAYFESTNVDPSTGFLKNNAAAPAQNVQVQILDATGRAIDLRDNTNNDGITLDASGTATLDYSAQYITTGGAAGGGDVETQLVYTMQYK